MSSVSLPQNSNVEHIRHRCKQDGNRGSLRFRAPSSPLAGIGLGLPGAFFVESAGDFYQTEMRTARLSQAVMPQSFSADAVFRCSICEGSLLSCGHSLSQNKIFPSPFRHYCSCSLAVETSCRARKRAPSNMIRLRTPSSTLLPLPPYNPKVSTKLLQKPTNAQEKP